MSTIPASLHRLVIQRAQERCEYCKLSQASQEASFHIDHIRPRAAHGSTTLENLALACVSCSLRKAAKETAVDPSTGEPQPLFNPRTQSWVDHFRWDGGKASPLTSTARATVQALAMNRPLIVAIRLEEMARGRYPYP